ncbi:sporulation protein [Hazenella sp. IB182357]|uniref:Sporulation protein n=1 Tax=Polycladospora coralii TaxID=2771432 RepID=A0A926N720_9BACL|nr:sporulation protein [Polycladospora coralii]MBD1373789.1 sporulation protein [Polycladospora coralii]
MILRSLASLGIGAAVVDTQLEDKPIYAGDLLKGEVCIQGGEIEQLIDDIYFYLMVEITKNDKKKPYMLKKIHLSEGFTIQRRMTKKIPFEVRIPLETPMSTGSFRVFVKTGLDIKKAIDPQDVDDIDVVPPALIQKLLKEVENGGFILYKISNQYDQSVKPHPFFQMFQFKPTGKNHGLVDELGVIFSLSDREMHMDIEIVRAGNVLHTDFYWSFEDIGQPLLMNREQRFEDPILKLQEILNTNQFKR